MVCDDTLTQNNNGSRKRIFNIPFFQLSVFFFSCLCGMLVLLFAETNKVYWSIQTLPFVYAITTLFLRKMYVHVFRSLVTISLLGGFFVQLVLTPVLFAIGGYVSFFGNIATEEGVFYAVVLLSLECFIVLLVANYYVSSTQKYGITEVFIDKSSIGRLNVVVVSLVSFLVFAYFFVPEIQTIYIPFFKYVDFNQLVGINWDNETIVERGGLRRYIYSLFVYFWPIVRMLLQGYLIVLIYDSSFRGLIKRGLVIITLLIPSLLLSRDNIAPIIGIIFGMLLNFRIYGKKILLLFCSIMCCGFVLISMMFVSKIVALGNWHGSGGLGSIAYTFQAYFPGFDNIAMVMQVEDSNKFESFFFDIYSVIPFKETLFGLHGDTLYDLMTYIAGKSVQIVPWCANLAYYFTIPGAIFITAWLVKSVYVMEKNFYVTSNFWMAYIYLGLIILLSMGIFTYNPVIVLRSIVNVWLPIFVILKFCRLI